MAPKSLILAHPNRLAMERQYLQGKSIASIARGFDVSVDSLRNHLTHHLSRQMVKAYEIKSNESSFNLLGEIDQIITDTKTIFKRNFDQNKDITALKAIDSQRSTLELLCKISALMHDTKLLELQEQQEGNQQFEQDDFSDRLKFLTKPELEMLLALQSKIDSRNAKIIVIAERPNAYANITADIATPPLRHTNILVKQEQPKKRLKMPKTANVEPVRETLADYNARIQAEEPGMHEYINGRILPFVENPDDPRVQLNLYRQREQDKNKTKSTTRLY